MPDFVTFSRNVFLPVINVCRNHCRYCGFRRDPTHPEANLMTADEVEKMLEDHKDGQVGRVGHKTNFSRYFYRYQPPRPLEEIEADIKTMKKEVLETLQGVT